MDLATAQDAVDSVFDAMGVEAKYGDGTAGDGDDCDVILWNPRKARDLPGVQLAHFGVAESPLYILVRKAQVAVADVNFAFRLEETAAVYRIGEEAPVPHDIHGLTWRCAVVLEASA